MSRLFICLLFLGVAKTAADETFGGPKWIPLGEDGGEVAELFRSSEVLQMYHLQATGRLYEKGGLNHDMSFFLTAVGFYSLERPDVKVSLAYHPSNMTISLLPVISEDGQQLHWENQEASVSFVTDIDQGYWTGASYMGGTTGAFFSYAVEFSRDYHLQHLRYQPFSVYEDYPGRAFVVASSCDEYVWELLSEAQERGVRLAPAVMPQKFKIVIYSQTEPEIITLSDVDSTTTRDGNLTLHSSPSSEDYSDEENKEGNSDTDGDSWGRRRRRRLSDSREAEFVSRLPLIEYNIQGHQPCREADDSGSREDVDSGLLRGEGQSVSIRGAVGLQDARDDDLERGGSEAEAAAIDVTMPPSTEAPSLVPSAVALDDKQQVVAYYQSLQLCLQERKFNFVTSLKDFAQYFDCLDDVAFISIDPYEYYKVNLTSTKMDHIVLAEDLPEVDRRVSTFTWVDISLGIWIVLIMTCGIHVMLWQGGVVQHWVKQYMPEPIGASSPEDGDTDAQPPSVARTITGEYLKLGQKFLGTPQSSTAIISPTSRPINAQLSAASSQVRNHSDQSVCDSNSSPKAVNSIGEIEGGLGTTSDGAEGVEMTEYPSNDAAGSKRQDIFPPSPTLELPYRVHRRIRSRPTGSVGPLLRSYGNDGNGCRNINNIDTITPSRGASRPQHHPDVSRDDVEARESPYFGDCDSTTAADHSSHGGDAAAEEGVGDSLDEEEEAKSLTLLLGDEHGDRGMDPSKAKK